MSRRAVIAAATGTTIEWYDFFLYGVAAALVFPERFFPGSDPYVGTLLAFSTYFVGFASRPLGAAFFGHFGDRVGRKATLVATLLLMGFSTMSIGLIPDYERIGFWGPLLLTVFRALQGIAVGGEWGGAVLLAGEWTRPGRRGFATSFAQFGAPAGLVLANGALALMTLLTSEEAFLDWGWRVPFLLSAVLVILGLYIRLGIHETPVFARVRSEGRVEGKPVMQVLRHNGREVALTALLRTGQQSSYYIFTTYVLTYGTQELGLERGLLLNLVMLQAMISMVTTPWFGHLSDVLGRRRVVAFGCVAMMLFPFLYFPMLESGILWLIALAVVAGGPVHDLQYGPQAALISESFPGKLRYSGASLGYQLASITAGGPAPLIAVFLFHTFGTSMAVAAYIAIAAAVSLACVSYLEEHAGALDHA